MSTAKRLLKLVDKHRQIEVAKVEASGRNAWDLRVEGRAHPYSGVGGTWLDSDNSEGEEVAIAFGFGNPLLPIMFSRGSRPLAAFAKSDKSVEPKSWWKAFGSDFGRGFGLLDGSVGNAAMVIQQSVSGDLVDLADPLLWRRLGNFTYVTRKVVDGGYSLDILPGTTTYTHAALWYELIAEEAQIIGLRYTGTNLDIAPSPSDTCGLTCLEPDLAPKWDATFPEKTLTVSVL